MKTFWIDVHRGLLVLGIILLSPILLPAFLIGWLVRRIGPGEG